MIPPYDSRVLWREGLMKRFVEGVDRSQSTMFPEQLEDWIGADNPVRRMARPPGRPVGDTLSCASNFSPPWPWSQSRVVSL